METIECAGGIVINKEGKIGRVKNDSRGFPKGKIKNRESKYNASAREIREEMGIKNLTFCKRLGDYYRPSKSGDFVKHITMYLFTTIDKVGEITAKDIKKAKFSKFEKVIEKLEHQEDKDFLLSVQEEVYDNLMIKDFIDCGQNNEKQLSTSN